MERLARIDIFSLYILLVGQPCISMRVLGINLHQTQNTENKKMETTQDICLVYNKLAKCFISKTLLCQTAEHINCTILLCKLSN